MTGEDPLLAALAAARNANRGPIMISGCFSLMPASMCSRALTGWPTWPRPWACPPPVFVPPTPRPTSSTPPG